MANERRDAKRATLSHDRLTEVLSYDPDTGIFVWCKRISIRIVVGKVAGVIGKNGHRYIRIDNIRFVARQLAWFYIHGVWPLDQIDHKDLVSDNNAIANLRESTQSQNCRNVTMRRNNRSGYKGVIPHDAGGFVAQISYDGRTHYLGYSKDPLVAYAMYCEASKKHHGEFGRLS